MSFSLTDITNALTQINSSVSGGVAGLASNLPGLASAVQTTLALSGPSTDEQKMGADLDLWNSYIDQAQAAAAAGNANAAMLAQQNANFAQMSVAQLILPGNVKNLLGAVWYATDKGARAAAIGNVKNAAGLTG
jgi:hypothetical protein